MKWYVGKGGNVTISSHHKAIENIWIDNSWQINLVRGSIKRGAIKVCDRNYYSALVRDKPR